MGSDSKRPSPSQLISLDTHPKPLGEEEADAAATATGAAAAAIGGTGAMTCSRCRVSLPVAERVAHYQSPWHLLNLRRSLAKRCVSLVLEVMPTCMHTYVYVLRYVSTHPICTHHAHP